MKIDLNPKTCNVCGGKNVTYESNSIIYGREYGSGKCYYCPDCRSYVGTHKPRPKEALGILADETMRELKKECHALFDPLWKEKGLKRNALYETLANALGIPKEECHFGWFNEEMLRKAKKILEEWGKEIPVPVKRR